MMHGQTKIKLLEQNFIYHILYPASSIPSFALASFPPKSYPSDKKVLYLL